ncbi:transglycosylase SLT domain-containing protein [Pseudoroseicyclus tamaricis]|uniref:Lytic transglycosylase domain-containing protein n=1 Tax=Pseudoroseicyclus tamaricis TaxID=2705421 RepID=A0A6B2JG67_9RHOB|nr:transglycosylase SLT domain-containing protein [Pseudoroseicyclus tamaricis]NDV00141.1 lytic transglycosylase domain-containing protein [Pseudoroseicyclus tamaricis]
MSALRVASLLAAALLATPLRAELVTPAWPPAALAEAPDARPTLRPEWIERIPPVQTGATVRPVARDPFLPAARWGGSAQAMWTRAALSAMDDHGEPLVDTLPRDIGTWCPGYATASEENRQAFWVGLLSALAWYESTHRPTAVGGGGQWFGLTQIYPPTARSYGCRAETGGELKDAEDNLSCAIRILATTVPRDGAVALHDGRWRGVAADWGPMTSSVKRAAMAEWTSRQSYCQVHLAPEESARPLARPAHLGEITTAMND